MRKTQPGVDRTETVAARTLAATLAWELKVHKVACYQCHHAGPDVYGHCAEWWEAARALHRARRHLRTLEAPTIDGMLTLPGMDEL